MCARGLLLLILRVRRGQSCPRWWKKGEEMEVGRAVSQRRGQDERERERGKCKWRPEKGRASEWVGGMGVRIAGRR